eukprot:CAMPEP_0183489752 /NCGR_PEP_ID=MMETSP0370-20130417/181600_1 /TAXON_ID=268820 /ORGANISM="Peridinium aciculiferum, Strain PAER-2" /LENGTH=281 /DNA_ID=CAMNT_0025683087 /DNA_START=150 /DNA_END=997 /DNA_ORIENTATION=-
MATDSGLMEHTAAGAAAFTSETSSHPSSGDLQKNRPLVGIGDIGENLRESRLVWCASRGVVCVEHGGPLPAWNHRVEADQQAVDDNLATFIVPSAFQCPECDHDGCDDVSHPEVDALAMAAHRDPNTVVSRNHPAQRRLVQDGIHPTFVVLLQVPWHGARADHELRCWAQVANRPKLGVIGVGILYVDVKPAPQKRKAAEKILCFTTWSKDKPAAAKSTCNGSKSAHGKVRMPELLHPGASLGRLQSFPSESLHGSWHKGPSRESNSPTMPVLCHPGVLNS